MVVRLKCPARGFVCFSLIICAVMLYIGINMTIHSDYDMLMMDMNNNYIDPHVHDEKRAAEAIKENIQVPIIIWWTPFTNEKGKVKRCGDVKCFFTADRHYRHHSKTKAFLFYGTDFKSLDLPVPRKAGEEWALLHEESPKNLYILSHEEVITLFNHTATFRRESDLPITTQYLPSISWLEDTSYIVPTKEKTRMQKLEGLAPFFYVHSDCDPPSDRDTFVRMLMKHMQVDCYGQCLHNKDLPEHLQDPIEGMDHHEFYKIQAKYKFSLAFENGICNDYITEKFWRPLMVGSVPVVMGSPKVKDFLPDKESAILVEDFASLDDFVDFMRKLNEDDGKYEEYLWWKKTGVTNKYLLDIMKNREWGINNDPNRPNFIDSFECLVCKRLRENEALKAAGKLEKVHQANQSHYGCPRPKRYNTDGRQVFDAEWGQFYDSAGEIAKALGYFIKNNITYDREKLYNKAYDMELKGHGRDLV